MFGTSFRTLLLKECRRFIRVIVQTVFTPMITSLLYLTVFGQVLSNRVTVYEGIGYLQFLVPGLVMMSIIQNAYANASSSLFQSKINGSINFILVSPITHIEIFSAYVLAAMLRSVLVGAGVLLVALCVVDVPLLHMGIVVLFVIASAALLATLGLLVGILAEQFEQMSAFQNFLIAPLSFLSGAFYSIHALPEIWRVLSHANPFFYMVDGFRYGFLGQSDVSPWLSLMVVVTAWLITSVIVLWLLFSGHKLRQ